MQTNQVIVLAPDYLLERIDNEITVYHPTLATTLYLNETGGLIWELCDGKKTVTDIVDILTELYPESKGHIQNDVINIISGLVEKNIASLKDGA